MPRKKKEKVELDLNVYTKSGKLRKRKRKQSRNYFNDDTEAAVDEYLVESDNEKRRIIFENRIYYSFYKLAENLIHTYKYYHTDVDHIEQLKYEVVTMLHDRLKLGKYNRDKGKAYGYFGTIARRWLIQYNKDNYNREKEHADLNEVDDNKGIFTSIVNEESDNDLIEFFDKYVKYIETNFTKLFDKDPDRKIAWAILDIFKKRENFDILNKQAFYVYTKEITGNTAPQITKVVKQLKELFKKLMNEYYQIGDIYI